MHEKLPYHCWGRAHVAQCARRASISASMPHSPVKYRLFPSTSTSWGSSGRSARPMSELELQASAKIFARTPRHRHFARSLLYPVPECTCTRTILPGLLSSCPLIIFREGVIIFICSFGRLDAGSWVGLASAAQAGSGWGAHTGNRRTSLASRTPRAERRRPPRPSAPAAQVSASARSLPSG